MKRLLWILAALAMLALLAPGFAAEPLLDYVKKSDSTGGKWKAEPETTLPNGVHRTDIKFTSQTWHDIKWEHHLTALRPEKLSDHPTALLYITGNYHEGEAAQFAPLVAATNQPLFILWNVPNQPLFNNLSEDALISETLVRTLQTGDATWPLLFPMTKSALRAMDVAQKFSKKDWKSEIPSFVVAGASKRGWTTWMTAATGDPRVIGIAPMVYNNLNLGLQMRHQMESWGKYSEQIADYTEKGLQDVLNTPKGRELSAMIDPYTFRDRITIPKLLINGTNDRYWALDAAGIYLKDLKGSTNLLTIPNAGHGLEDRQRVFGGLGAFWLARADGKTLPYFRAVRKQYSKKDGEDGLLWMTADTSEKSKTTRVWVATAPTRDFREAKWTTPTAIPREGLSADVPKDQYVREGLPVDGSKDQYVAAFVEAEFEGKAGPYMISTPVSIFSPKGEDVTAGEKPR